MCFRLVLKIFARNCIYLFPERVTYIEKSVPDVRRLGWLASARVNGRCTYRKKRRCVSLQKAERKRRHDYPDAEVARRDRAAQSSQATKNCRGSETTEARERRSTRDRDRRKRRLDSESATHDACIAETTFQY